MPRNPVCEASIQAVLSKLRQCSSKQPLLQGTPPRPLRPGIPGDTTTVPFRHPTPESAVRRGPSPSWDKISRPQYSLTEHDQEVHGFNDPPGVRHSERYRDFESRKYQASSVTADRELDETDRQRWRPGTQWDIGPPRSPPVPPPRGMKPPSLLALDIQPPLMLQQPDNSRKEFSDPSDGQNNSSCGNKVQNQQPPPSWLNLGRDRQFEKPPPLTEEDRFGSRQVCPRPPDVREGLRLPGIPEGFRPPRFPGARPPSLPQSVEPAHSDVDSQPPQQQFSVPRQNFTRPSSFLADSGSRPSSLQEDSFLSSQGCMPQVQSSRSENDMQKYHRMPTPDDFHRQRSRESQLTVASIRGLSASDSNLLEDEHHPSQTPTSGGLPSLMALNVLRAPVRPPMRHSLPPANVPTVSNPRLSAPDLRPVDDSYHPARDTQVGMCNEPLQFTGPMAPRSVDDSFQLDQPLHALNSGGLRPPFMSSLATPPVSNQATGVEGVPVRPVQLARRLPTPRVQEPASYSHPNRLPNPNMLALPPTQLSGDDNPINKARTFPPGMSDEPLQLTGRVPMPRVQEPSSYSRLNRMPNPSILAMPPPQSSGDDHQIKEAGTFPPGMSDEPLQFTGRVPMPRIQEPSSFSHLNRMPNPNIPAMPLPKSSGDDHQKAGIFPPGMLDKPLQFTGRMPMPRVQEPSSYSHPNRMPNPNIPSLPTLQSSGDDHEIEKAGSYPPGMSDEPLQFTGRMASSHIHRSSSHPDLEHLPASDIRPPLPSAHWAPIDARHVQTAVGRSNEPLQFTGRMPAPLLHDLRDTEVRSFSPNLSLNSSTGTTPRPVLHPPVRPPLRMPPPPFVGMPRQPLAPQPLGSRPHRGIPEGGVRFPPSLPDGAAFQPPVDRSISLLGSEIMQPLRAPVSRCMLPPPALPPPFFPSIPNMVCC